MWYVANEDREYPKYAIACFVDGVKYVNLNPFDYEDEIPASLDVCRIIATFQLKFDDEELEKHYITDELKSRFCWSNP